MNTQEKNVQRQQPEVTDAEEETYTDLIARIVLVSLTMAALAWACVSDSLLFSIALSMWGLMFLVLAAALMPHERL